MNVSFLISLIRKNICKSAIRSRLRLLIESINDRLTIFDKLLLGYLILLSIMVLPCVVSIYSLSKLETFATNVARHDIEVSRTIEYLKGILPSIEIEGCRLVTLHKKDSYNSLLSLVKDFNANLSKVQKNGPKKVSSIVQGIEIKLDKLVSLANNSMDSLSENRPYGTMPIEAQREKKVEALISNIMAGLSDLGKTVREELRHKSSTISDLCSHARGLTIIVLVGALAFALLAPWFLYKYIKQPIDQLYQGTEVIGQGHFDQAIPVMSHDELGMLAKAFNKMAARLKELDELKSDFIAVASHELKTPLTSMMESAKLLSEPKIGRLNKNQLRLITILNDSMTRFQKLIEELLQLSRLQAKIEAIEKYPMDITKIFSDIIKILRPIAQKKRLDIEINSVSGPEKEIPIDKERLFRAFMNILHNAIKFSPKDRKIKILLDHVKDSRGKWLKVGIIDAGPGIEKSDAEKIFDRFYQIQTIRREGGSGLGLAIAKEIILAHGGKIWVESPPPKDIAVVEGKGTVFWSVLPYFS
ncbi:MAG: HAMP domain-containing protein [Nitrospiraceae bacterium]|nr:HAMP domain-containing protein [Nitrospiraceae bacterium]